MVDFEWSLTKAANIIYRMDDNTPKPEWPVKEFSKIFGIVCSTLSLFSFLSLKAFFPIQNEIYAMRLFQLAFFSGIAGIALGIIALPTKQGFIALTLSTLLVVFFILGEPFYTVF